MPEALPDRPQPDLPEPDALDGAGPDGGGLDGVGAEPTLDDATAPDRLVGPRAGGDAPLLDEDEARARIRQDLQAEHDKRLASFARKRQVAKQQNKARNASRRQRQLEDLREAERRRFYVEKGYKQYTDSNGRSIWMPAEEYAWRMKRRKHRDRSREYRPSLWRRRQTLVLYGIAAIVAIALGLLLVG